MNRQGLPSRRSVAPSLPIKVTVYVNTRGYDMVSGVSPNSDAGPEDAAKVRFVRRRAAAVFGAHGYRELLPSALEPAGQAARLGLRAPALADGDGRELRIDAMVSLARVYGAGPDRGRFARRMMGGVLFDP